MCTADAPWVCVSQVLGHSKTVLVLLGGWAFLGDRVSSRQAFGMALAVAGMVAYGVTSSQCGPPAGMGSPGLCRVRPLARGPMARAQKVGAGLGRRPTAGGTADGVPQGGAAGAMHQTSLLRHRQ